MRYILIFIFAFLSIPAITQSSSNPNLNLNLNLIPQPVKASTFTGTYNLKKQLSIHFLNISDKTTLFKYLKNELLNARGLTLIESLKNSKPDIVFQHMPEPGDQPGTYRLTINKNGVLINTASGEGAFYAIQTLLQLVTVDNNKLLLPFAEILDYPRFAYRGMHLDVGRHFFPIPFIKKYIDYLAYHKFNRFHWHLTEDQGWRIEIKKYPKLTSIGGWRNGTIIGRYPGKGSDNKTYGGYYTQAEIKEIVNYAKQRYIDVIPEIEMPGHSSAAIAAYPSLSCFPDKPTLIPANMISARSTMEQQSGRVKLVQETWGVFDDVFCAGKDSTFLFLQNVIDEVIPLFPSKYFHIGADECPKTHWKQCPLCQQRMKENGLKDEHELQSYFVQRIEKYLNAKGKTLVGWDEILEGGLAPNAVVMSWRGEKGGIEAAKQNHEVIMTPGNPVYFDHTQSQNEDSVTIGGYNPLEKVYAYEPIPNELPAAKAKFILGAQANLWTEYIKNPRKVEYMIFPRMSALSEVLWSPKETRNWTSFERRLPFQFRRYEQWKANYSQAFYDLGSQVIPTENNEGVYWKLESRNQDNRIIYTTGPTVSATREYNSPILVKDSAHLLAAITGSDSRILGNWVEQQFFFNKATGKKISLKNPASSKYPGNGAFTLVDGVQNQKGLARSREFLGFEGDDCEVEIDLGKPETFSEVILHVFEQQASWIYFPSGFDLSGSEDGKQYLPFSAGVKITKDADSRKATIRFANPVTTRFLKIHVMNFGKIPEGKPGAGNRAWLFVDEIEVR